MSEIQDGERQAQAEAPAPKQEPLKEKDDATELLKAMAVAAVIALAIRSFLFEPFNIPSSSMFPNLLVGDYLFVKKWSYGYSRYSFPLDLIPFQGRIMASDAKRGDVIVFRQPKKVGIDYIKRLIGMPGDKIQVKEGRLYINGDIVQRDLVGNETYPDEEGPRIFTKYIETLPPVKEGGEPIKHYIYELSDNDSLDNTPEFTVPPGHYFMMGDNRDRSLDSRVPHELGYVPADNLIGPASFIFFSTEGIGEKCEYDGTLAAIKSTFCRIYEYPKAVRYSRLFRRVHAFDK